MACVQQERSRWSSGAEGGSGGLLQKVLNPAWRSLDWSFIAPISCHPITVCSLPPDQQSRSVCVCECVLVGGGQWWRRRGVTRGTLSVFHSNHEQFHFQCPLSWENKMFRMKQNISCSWTQGPKTLVCVTDYSRHTWCCNPLWQLASKRPPQNGKRLERVLEDVFLSDSELNTFRPSSHSFNPFRIMQLRFQVKFNSL